MEGMRGGAWIAVAAAAIVLGCGKGDDDAKMADIRVTITGGTVVFHAFTEFCLQPLEEHGPCVLEKTCEGADASCVEKDVAVDVTDGTQTVRLSQGLTSLPALGRPLRVKASSPAFDIPVSDAPLPPDITAPSDGTTASVSVPLTVSWTPSTGATDDLIEVSPQGSGCLPYRLSCEFPPGIGSASVPPEALRGLLVKGGASVFVRITSEWKDEVALPDAHVTIVTNNGNSQSRSLTLTNP